ncbi:hypothetical protein CO151_11300 [bacterium CG_4_9_14_3_um_filter_65_15]|nr:MAG: hypothetical protein CO151_11300 [bacterium CG_4_9_14_3_um_filter_65_15]
MHATLISPTDTWAIWTILLAAAALGLLGERTTWGRRLSGVILTMGATFALSNLGVIPADGVPAYDVVWGYLVPLAIPLLLLRADLKRILREAGPTLIAYVLGAMGTVIGTIVAFKVVPLGESGWQLASIFSATYIGGSMNYAAAAEAVGLHSGDLLSAGVAADNLVMALYFLVLFALPGIGWLSRLYRQRTPVAAPATDDPAATGPAHLPRFPELGRSALAVALAMGLCGAGYAIARVAGWQGGGILVITALTVTLATALPGRMQALDGAEVMGAFLMQIFFAVIGASANVGIVMRVGPMLFLFAALILCIHLVFLLLAGKLLRLDLAEMVIASNANMGGPTTAAAMAVARRWDTLVLPAILCGTLGYATATFLGVALGHWLR